jgi:hydrogenase nickel incorporation protein HypB
MLKLELRTAAGGEMDRFKILEIKESVFKGNDERAAALRAELKRDKVLLVNLMSSPGSGKTTTLVRTIEAMKEELRIGILEADVDSDVDARRVAETGARVIQLHTGGMCHLDAEMTRQGLAGLGIEGLDLVVLENVGNLICTADFDTGATKNVMILSVPEGDDKPLKYPLMFKIVDLVLVNKMDAMSLFDFDMDAFRERVMRLNPKAGIIPISAKTGEGMDAWAEWLRAEVGNWKRA